MTYTPEEYDKVLATIDFSATEQRIMQQMNENSTVSPVESLEARVKDLTCSLSKQTRKNHALNEAIGFMANKNSGLRHRIKMLQRYIAKLKAEGVGAPVGAPVEVREVVRYLHGDKPTWSDVGITALFCGFSVAAVYGIYSAVTTLFF